MGNLPLTGHTNRPNRRHLTLLIALILAASLMATEGLARDFRFKLGPNRLEGLVDLELAYGIRWRAQDQDPEIIGIGNGGSREVTLEVLPGVGRFTQLEQPETVSKLIPKWLQQNEEAFETLCPA